MHTILGAGGPVANALTRELISNKQPVTLVSRRPTKFTDANITWKRADLLNYDELAAACEVSNVIYLCACLVYDAKIWAVQWPIIMRNVINVTKKEKARLIFFDNVYMYGLVNGPMLETTPYHPVSEKGKIRAGIASMLMDEVKEGNIRASIARAADFYGTDSMNAVFDMLLLDKYAKKQTAQWTGSVKTLHNFSYISDMGKAMYLLGQNSDSDNQIWHLPTAKPMRGKEFIELAASIYHVKPKFFAINKFSMWLFGLFNKPARGVVEMFYQFDHDYIFDSSKFEKAFNFKPTSYADGIKELSETLYKA